MQKIETNKFNQTIFEMKKQFIKNHIYLLVIICGITTFSFCEDNWNQHYNFDNEIVSDKTLWEKIQSTPNLSKFAKILKKAGYDKILSESQMYTVWAPVDSALVDFNPDCMDNVKLEKEFICNHIGRFSYSASGNVDAKVSVLNKKIISFKTVGSDYYFEDAKLIQRNEVSSNGILHIINKRVVFFNNIWEYLEKDQRLDSVRKYFYSFNQIIFDVKNSIPGDVNAQGKTVYLDSVFYNANVLFKTLGRFTNEDSTYNVILPTNSAWIKSYNKIKNNFRYYVNGTTVTQYMADTLQRHYTTSAIVQDLAFSPKWQLSPQDSLVSTQKSVFLQPQYLFNGAEKVVTSNGNLFVTNDLKYNIWESWGKKIIVEAETILNRVNTLSSIYTRSADGSYISGISGKKYVDIIPSSSSSNPTISFDIPNVLSGCAYNIYCVFVPASATNLSATDLKPCKVNFQLTYLKETGGFALQTYDNGAQSFVTDKANMSKVLVASNFIFPYSNFGQDIANVKLKVISNVPQNQTTLFTRELLIDCIILEPVH